jgi:polar amino acid transport system substrate-binding protein
MQGKNILFMFLFLSITTLVHSSEPINVICFELPPYCYIENNEIKGVVVDIYNEIREKTSYKLNDIVMRPLSRAFYELAAGNTILLILTRTEERESKYQWILKIYSDALVFINSATEKPINTYEVARNSGTILTRQNAVTEETLKSNGIVNIDSSSLDEEQQFLKLQYKRATTWFVPLSVGKSILSKNNVMDQYNIGEPVSNMDLYIAGSKDISDENIDEMRKASYLINRERIYKKYGLE